MAFPFARFVVPLSILALCLGSATAALGQDPVEQLPKPAQEEDDPLRLPGPDQLFRIRSEEGARFDIREAAMRKGVKTVEFPAAANPPAKLTDPAHGPPLIMTVPLGGVCCRPLYFEDIRTERDLKSCGVVEPLRSAFLFYGKALILPEMMVVVPPCRYRCWTYPFAPYSEWPYPEPPCRE